MYQYRNQNKIKELNWCPYLKTNWSIIWEIQVDSCIELSPMIADIGKPNISVKIINWLSSYRNLLIEIELSILIFNAQSYTAAKMAWLYLEIFPCLDNI